MKMLVFHRIMEHVNNVSEVVAVFGVPDEFDQYADERAFEGKSGRATGVLFQGYLKTLRDRFKEYDFESSDCTNQ